MGGLEGSGDSVGRWRKRESAEGRRELGSERRSMINGSW
jgi:hypothetical protein